MSDPRWLLLIHQIPPKPGALADQDHVLLDLPEAADERRRDHAERHRECRKTEEDPRR